ncbi:hypothetical protein PIB30_020180 [Stylosanthes scabra]|uniref:Uncharacterized protein n=1 Tax=Stylosanthes scabra TaxID=79078 RepID=A0ABU6Q8D6_9FABA|nr:hypothetical protein [Stylosanthes scabra]
MKKDQSLYSQCGFFGHTVNKCYKLYGYPPNYDKGRGNKPSVNHDATPMMDNESDSSTPLNLINTHIHQTLINSSKVQELLHQNLKLSHLQVLFTTSQLSRTEATYEKAERRTTANRTTRSRTAEVTRFELNNEEQIEVDVEQANNDGYQR